MSLATKRLFTVDEYERMVEVGILAEDDRVELLNGEIIEKISPIGSWHSFVVNELHYQLLQLLDRSNSIRNQSSIKLTKSSMPEPDLIVLKYQADRYRHQLPGPSDILLIIEVSDSTLDIDQHTKLPLYAQCSIPEVWIVNGRDDQIEQYTQPSATGYQSVKKYKAGETITSQQLPQIQLAVQQFMN
jgi:Uma2 family endonuclease